MVGGWFERWVSVWMCASNSLDGSGSVVILFQPAQRHLEGSKVFTSFETCYDRFHGVLDYHLGNTERIKECQLQKFVLLVFQLKQSTVTLATI